MLPSTSATDRLQRFADHHLKPVTLQAPPPKDCRVLLICRGSSRLQSQATMDSFCTGLVRKVKPEKTRERRVLGTLLCTLAWLPSQQERGKKNPLRESMGLISQADRGARHSQVCLSFPCYLIPRHLDRSSSWHFLPATGRWPAFPPTSPSCLCWGQDL